MKSNNYHNFHHRYDANTEHNKDREAKLTCIDNVDGSVGNGPKKTEKAKKLKRKIIMTCPYVRIVVTSDTSAAATYDIVLRCDHQSLRLNYRDESYSPTYKIKWKIKIKRSISVVGK